MTESGRNEGKFSLRTWIVASLAGLSLLLSTIFIISPEASSDNLSAQAPEGHEAAQSPEAPQIKRFDFRLTGADTFYHFMTVLNVPGPEIMDIVEKARPIFDLRQLRRDTVLKVFTLEEKLQKIEYKYSDYETLIVEKAADGSISAVKSELPHEHREAVVSGTIEVSLYEDGIKAGADPQAVMALTDIFAWDIDFASDIRKGDTFKILTEVLYVEGRPVKTGKIMGAEMVNGGKKYTAVYYEGKGGGGYYDANGKSLERTLLKSPLRFRRITSHFSKGRFHPIHKRYRPHHGVDYGAPTGTPIEAAGSGVVKYAGWKGGYGNYVEIRHSNGYSTAYGHLSRIGKGTRTGAKVSQGSVIGYVGSTGISTGPHLHYEVKVNGRLVNPLSIKSFPGKALAGKDKERFASVRDEVAGKFASSGTAYALKNEGN